MLVRFSSTATGSITLFGDSAAQLINILGASGAIPGAISAEDIPAALKRLRQQLHVQAAATQASEHDDEKENEEREPQISLATRAVPLIDLLERASAGNAPVMWEAG
jgi:Domain of unknown function (DUF1840)